MTVKLIAQHCDSLVPLKIMSLLPYVIDGIPRSRSHDISKLKLSIGAENIKM